MGRRLCDWIRSLHIRTEPLLLLLVACNTVRGILSPTLSEAKMRRVYEAPSDLHGKDLDKFYNKKMVEWDNYYEYVNLPIACVLSIIYGGYSDHHGRKLPLLIGIASVMIENAVRMLIWSDHTDWPLEILFPLGVVCGLFGDFTMTQSIINAYVTDQFPNKRMLSIRMIIVSISFSVGSFGGSQIVNLLLNYISKIAILGIVQGGYIFAFFVGIYLLDSDLAHRELVEGEGKDPALSMTHAQKIKQSFRSFYDSFKMFSAPREGHRRLFLYLCFVANFLDQFVFGEEKSLIGTYTRLAPFKWDAHEYSRYKGVRPLTAIAGMLFGAVVLKRALGLRDTLIICMSIASMGVNVLLIGVARETWLVFAALLPGCLHGLLNPLTYAFISSLIEPHEIGKAFAISAIAQNVAGFAETAVLQNIYIATVDWWPAFVWMVMAAASFVSLFIYATVHVVAKKENIGA